MESPYDIASFVGGLIALGSLGYVIASGKGKNPVPWMFGVALFAIVILPVLVITGSDNGQTRPYSLKVALVVISWIAFELALIVVQST